MAGILSLINDVRLSKGLPSLGFVVPRIWKVAQEHPGEAFVDLVTPRNTSCGCGQCIRFPAQLTYASLINHLRYKSDTVV